MVVEVALSTGQLIPSIVTVIFEASVGKLTPVYVIYVPPSTDPYLGSTLSKAGVSEFINVTGFKSVTESPM